MVAITGSAATKHALKAAMQMIDNKLVNCALFLLLMWIVSTARSSVLIIRMMDGDTNIIAVVPSQNAQLLVAYDDDVQS